MHAYVHKQKGADHFTHTNSQLLWTVPPTIQILPYFHGNSLQNTRYRKGTYMENEMLLLHQSPDQIADLSTKLRLALASKLNF